MIDILMCTYNGELFIREQIDSILKQTLSEWKLYISDDGSSDNTWNILEFYEDKYPDKIKIFKNCGQHGAKANFWNAIHKVYQESASPYYMFCDQDDVWMPDKIQKTYAKMQEVEKALDRKCPVLIATDLTVVDSRLNMVNPSFRHYMNLPEKVEINRLMIQNNITGCTMMINRDLMRMANQVEKPECTLMHDHFIALMAEAFGKVECIPESTIYYRQHEDNSIGAANARGITYNLQRLRRGKVQFQKDIEQSAMQIAYFLQLFGAQIKCSGVKEMFELYASIWWYSRGRISKFKKLHFIFKYRTIKKGFNRFIMQLIWI